MKYLLFYIIPILVRGQDCGYLVWEVKYHSFPSNYELTVSLSDECESHKLIIDEEVSFSIKKDVDTVILKHDIVAPFIRILDQVDLDNLNSLENAFLNDGLYIDYYYITRQEEIVTERLHFPIVNLESLLYMEDELKILRVFYSLFSRYLSTDQLENYNTYIKPLIYDE